MIFIQLYNEYNMLIDEKEVEGSIGETIIKSNWIIQPGDTIKVVEEEYE